MALLNGVDFTGSAKLEKDDEVNIGNLDLIFNW